MTEEPCLNPEPCELHPRVVHPVGQVLIHPCEKCGKPRTRAEGGTTFTVCDECWDGPEEVRTMVMSWRVEHYRVKGLEVFPAFESHIYDPVVMLQCAHCLKAYGVEIISTIPRHRESLEAQIEALKDQLAIERESGELAKAFSGRAEEAALFRAEIEALKAERDKWRETAERRYMLLAGSDYERVRAEVARLEGLILADHDPSLDSSACCGRESIHAEARAIKATATGTPQDRPA